MRNKKGWTVLHYSARSGSYKLLVSFTDMGNGINLKIIDGKNYLHIAELYGHLNLCKTLISLKYI